MTLESFDRVAHCYDETRGLPDDIARRVGEGIASVLREVAGAPRVVEVGVGTGRIAVPLAAAGVRVTGIDIAPKMLARLREKRGDIDVMLAEAARPPLRHGSFDGALFVHILHLVPDAEATVRATLPLVRTGGVLMVAGDDRHPGLDIEGHRIVEAAVTEIAGIDLRLLTNRHDRAVEAFQRVMEEAGASLERVTLAGWTGAEQGRLFLERLRRRDYSGSWRIPAEIIPELIERVTPQIETLYDGLDLEHAVERSFSATVARLPGRGEPQMDTDGHR